MNSRKQVTLLVATTEEKYDELSETLQDEYTCISAEDIFAETETHDYGTEFETYFFRSLYTLVSTELLHKENVLLDAGRISREKILALIRALNNTQGAQVEKSGEEEAVITYVHL